MILIAARAIVALVPRDLSLAQLAPQLQLQAVTMRVNALAVRSLELAVLIRIASSYPRPALVWLTLLHLEPEAILLTHALMSMSLV